MKPIKILLLFSLFLQLPSYAKKVAFLVGNNDYLHSSKLLNAKNDSNDVSKVLKKHDFNVLSASNANETTMKNGLKRLEKEGSLADVCLFFFSGHGFQVGNQNFLVPVDGRLTKDPNKTMIPLSMILNTLKATKAKLKIVVLDCCRNNPFEKNSGGLAPISESNFPSGTLIVYSGSPGKTVPDGNGKNSPFTKELLAQLQPGRDCLTLFTSVAAARYKSQDPWIKFDGSGSTLSLLRKYDFLGAKGHSGKITKTSTTSNQQLKLGSLWDHNGSTMGLLANGKRRVIIYVRVRKGLSGFVEPGTVLFDGVSEGQRYIGNARRFSKGMKPILYHVAGPILNGGSKIVLKGKAPIRDKTGNVAKTINDELVFTYQKLASK